MSEPEPLYWGGPEAQTIYVLESFIPREERVGWLGRHLVALMVARGYEVVTEVRYDAVAPELIPHPEGRELIRASVGVREFDTEV